MRLNITRYARVLLALSKETEGKQQQEQLINNFFAFLKRHKQLQKAEEILQKMVELDDAEKGIARVDIISARPLSPEALSAASSYAKQLFRAKEVIPTSVTDPQIIGGIQLKTDTALFDASLKTQLRRLGKELKEGTATIS